MANTSVTRIVNFNASGEKMTEEEWKKICLDNQKLTYYQTNMYDYYANDDEMAGCEEVAMMEIEE